MDYSWQKKSADAFLLGAVRCLEQRWKSSTEFEMALFPGVVCLAFSIELGMKAILTKFKKPPKTHNLKILFEALPENIRLEISSHVNIVPLDFYSELEKSAKTFEEWRYVYELEKPEVNLQFLSILAEVVKMAAEKHAT